MNKKEFSHIISALGSNYKGFVVDNQASFEFWFEALKDLDYNICQTAIQTIVMQEEFQPTIAMIRRICLEVQGVSILKDDQVLALVSRAVNYGRYRQVEAMEWLKSQDEIVYDVVKKMGFVACCNAKNDYMISNAVKFYKGIAISERKDNQLPQHLKIELEKFKQHSLDMIENEDDDYDQNNPKY